MPAGGGTLRRGGAAVAGAPLRICLISPYGDISSLGVRQLTACLAQEGHPVRQIFLTRERYFSPDFHARYADSTLDDVVELCRSVDLVGISTMTNYVASAIQVTGHLARALPDLPVVWGGVHATACPEASLRHAHMVAMGEAERSLPLLARRLERGEPAAGTPGFWVRKGGDLVKGPTVPPVQDLDDLPDPDWSLADDYALCWGKILPLDRDRMLERMVVTSGRLVDDFDGPMFKLFTSRGCLYHCAYCCNSLYRKMYGRKWRIRHRSLDRIMAEIRAGRERYPEVRGINFADDLLLGGSPDRIPAFARRYADEVGLPFFCLQSPVQITHENMENLVGAGLRIMEVGIQSGSPATLRRYRRPVQRKHIDRACRVLHDFRGRVTPRFDFLVDDPFEEPEERLESLRVVESLPRPAHLALFSLTLYPGTALHRQGMARGIVDEEGEMLGDHYYLAKQATWLNILLLMHRGGLDPRLLRFLGRDEVIRQLSRPGFETLTRRPVNLGMEILRQRMDIRFQWQRLRKSRQILGPEGPAGQGLRADLHHLGALFGPGLVKGIRMAWAR